MSDTINPAGRGRIEAIDAARAVALFAMAIFHFAWDLEFFGYAPRGLTADGGWQLFARCIASSFLFLVGVSLVLGHGRAIRWPAFWKRWLQVAAGAAVITLVTWFATPGSFVFFGILHEIALASLLGLVFLRLPWFVTALAAVLVIALPALVSTPLTDPRPLAWIGFSDAPPVSNDFVPVFPWFAAVLAGIAAARLATDRGWWDKLRAWNSRLGGIPLLGTLGRHSLLFYLIHQPVLIGLIWVAAQVAPPDPVAIFQGDCRRACSVQRDAPFCERYCGCAQTRMEESNLLAGLLNGEQTANELADVQAIVRECSFTSER